jgi:glutathione S-transferase
LEERYSERSILPPDPVHRFLAELIEDMADEWLTKAMFHYRWYYEPDQAFASWWIASDGLSADSVPRADREVFAREFGQHQIDRMGMVGCTDENKLVIEETYRRVLEALETRCGLEGYLFGTRPSLADFGLFGQLKTLGDDPTPRAEISRIAPTALHWIRQTDDLSGNDGKWLSADTELPEAVTALLLVCGMAYLPFLAANMRALKVGEPEVALTIFGKPYAQSPFRYQGKCYSRLRSLYGRLEGRDKLRADAFLEPTGCRRLLE